MAETKPSKISPSPGVFRGKLLAWHACSGRHDLPWRQGFSPYHVLVSELMLQQTTVATVIPYFHRFLKAFPSLEKLAAAPVERVLELWSGLGYYARARNLRAAAQKILRDFNGRMPDTAEAVRSLPGVGRYTAGAILSFAFNKREAVVDGNVIRVLSRIYGIKDNVKDPKVLERIWALAWQLVPPKGGRDFNSALMDLGATVCRPLSPDCLVCPFFSVCWARRHGRQEALPMSAVEKARKEVHVHVGLVQREGHWALVQRPADGLYAGLWEFPGEPAPQKNLSQEAALSLLAERWGLVLDRLTPLPSLKHVLSHREMHIHPWVGRLPKTNGKPPLPLDGALECRDGSSGRLEWRTLDEAEKMAISSLTRKIITVLRTRKLEIPQHREFQ